MRWWSSSGISLVAALSAVLCTTAWGATREAPLSSQRTQRGESTLVYGRTAFVVPKLKCGPGLALRPRPASVPTKQSAILRALDSRWDVARFQEGRRPLRVGVVQDRALFTTQRNIRVLDMPIKLSGSIDDYRLPKELEPFREVIQRMIDHEHAMMPAEALRKYNAYLTIDQQWVEAGTTQRKEGVHVDGFQGSRVTEKREINHSYVVSNLTPTAFFTRPLHLGHLDDRVHNFFLEMDAQTAGQKPTLTKEGEIYLMDAYTPHAATEATRSGYRTFIRLSYDVRQFDRLGNTNNPLFDYRWKMVPREVHSTLLRYAPPTPREQAILARLTADDRAINADARAQLRQLLATQDRNDPDRFLNVIHRALSIGDFAGKADVLRALAPHVATDVRALKVAVVGLGSGDPDVSTLAEQLVGRGLRALSRTGGRRVARELLTEILTDPRYHIADESGLRAAVAK